MSSSVDKLERSSGGNSHRVAFDRFELDLRSGELRKDGRRIRLQAQPFQLLAMLIENAGEVVMRDEVCRALWQADTFVDFDHSVAAAVNKIREALGDSVENPRFVETLPKRGYRFIGKIKPEAPVVMAVAKPQQSVELVPVPAVKAWTSRKWTLGLVAAAFLVAAAVLFGWLSRKPGNSKPMTVVPFTSYPGSETAPSFSPDGSRIAFSWDNGASNRSGRPRFDLYVKAIGSETLLRLTNHPSEWISSTWSPDGTQIAFHRLSADDTGIYVVPALGGPERKLLATHIPYSVAAPISWSPDGKWLAFADTEDGRPDGRVFLLNMETLESHEFPHDPSCNHEGSLTFSHSGQELAMVCVHNTTSFEYFVTDLQGKSKRSLATRHEFPCGLAWSGDDKSLIVSGASPEAEEFYAIRVGDGEVRKLPVGEGEWPTISRDGHKLAFSLGADSVNIWRKDLEHPQAPALQMLVSTRQQNNSQYSPDGKHVAFDSARSGTWSVWVADADGTNLVQISHEGPAGFPRWSPDSQKITFDMIELSGLAGMYTADISDRVAHKLKTNVGKADHPYWSHDGKWIYFRGSEGVGHQLYRCPVGGGDATLLAGSLDLVTSIESSDGKVLYFPSRIANSNIMMLALDHSGATPQEVSGIPKVFNESQWTLVPDGLYFAPQDSPRSICFFDFATRHTREVFKADKDLGDGMSISPDGRYLLYSQIDESNSNIMLVNYFH
ncbi:MAG TPA: winged helix-turn-helix domain-containing protein [Candidatus Acidoferrum sp.]|nr:winged helix-turn-helix domain-containing protein [Candidatus Acidoferrum sp.]